MADTDDVEVEAERVSRKVSHPWQKAAVVTALVVAALVAHLWFSRPPAYVGNTDGALLTYDGCARAYVLSAQPEITTVGPSPSQHSHSWAHGRPWVTPASDTPSELTTRAGSLGQASGFSGTVHFSSVSSGVFTFDNGATVKVARRSLPAHYGDCGILGAN